jgi:DNA-binding NarL/FixJ family response regulator
MAYTQKQRIIIADDQRGVRSSLRLLLEQQDSVIVAGEAADAVGLLRLLAEKETDVLLLDWELPGLPITQLLRFIQYEHPHLPILPMSVRPEAHQQALDAGLNLFLSKGAPPETVRQTLAQMSKRPPGLVSEPG